MAGAPYFETEDGAPWAPIGANDACDWPELGPLFRRKDPAAVEAHLGRLVARGVTVIRMMLEYAHKGHRWLEKPVGRFVPNMVQFWDDLIAMCERVGMRLLLTPMDTYFQWVRWDVHPLNVAHGGPCADRTRLMVCPATRAVIKRRLEFATRRWGGSGAVFGWDLWNEMHPAQADGRVGAFAEYIEDVGPWLRALETEVHGRAHPQTVSIFTPELAHHPDAAWPIYAHPALDFANPHLYAEGTIDDPKDTVAAAVAAGRLIADAVAHAPVTRPVFDSEHGPIHRFKDKRRSLPPAFDTEYFRHIQWAHLASGGAGGGMRWPNRKPHVILDTMRDEQARLAGFLPAMDWRRFDRRVLTGALKAPGFAVFGCASGDQALVYLLRKGTRGLDGRVRADAEARSARVALPGMDAGRYRMRAYATRGQGWIGDALVEHGGGELRVGADVVTDVMLAVTRA